MWRPSRQQMKIAATEYAPMLFGIRIPGFIRVHWRYFVGNPFVWMVLVIAPFIIGLVTVFSVDRAVEAVDISGWQAFLLVLFLIALAFHFAERNRTFRKVYVAALPGMVLLNGFLIYVFDDGYGPWYARLIVFGLLAALPAWVLWKLSSGMGYRMLSNGGDRHYRAGRDLYMAGEHAQGLLKLEPSAKRGNMKSLFLLGDAHEHGRGSELDRVRAARFYDASAKRGYRRGQAAFERLSQSFTEEERDAFESDVSAGGLVDLF